MRINSDITKTLFDLTKDDHPFFADYCRLLDIGLRKDALRKLNDFLQQTEQWSYKERADFCSLIFSVNKADDLQAILTTQLSDKLFKPTLLQMTKVEPLNFLPFSWYGHFYSDNSFLKKAFELNPNDVWTKLNLLSRLEKALWFSTHHLPEGYLGDYDEDISDLNLGFSILKTLDVKLQKDFLNRFTTYKRQIDNYKPGDKTPSH